MQQEQSTFKQRYLSRQQKSVLQIRLGFFLKLFEERPEKENTSNRRDATPINFTSTFTKRKSGTHIHFEGQKDIRKRPYHFLDLPTPPFYSTLSATCLIASCLLSVLSVGKKSGPYEDLFLCFFLVQILGQHRFCHQLCRSGIVFKTKNLYFDQ